MPPVWANTQSMKVGNKDGLREKPKKYSVISIKRWSLYTATKPDSRPIHECTCEELGCNSCCTYDTNNLVIELWAKPKKLFLWVKALCDTYLAQTLLTYSDSGSDLLSECRHSPEWEWAARCVLSARKVLFLNEEIYFHTDHLNIRVISCLSWVYASRVSSNLYLGGRKQIYLSEQLTHFSVVPMRWKTQYCPQKSWVILIFLCFLS